MSHLYLDWIEDEDLINAVKKVHEIFAKAAKQTTLKTVTRNVIDPFTFIFETELLSEIDVEQWIADEVKRQIQKTLTNAIGDFHQTILGSVNGWTNLNTGHSTGVDVKKNDETVFAEIKNKYNTVTGARQDSVFNVLRKIANTKPEATCYLVHMVKKDKQSYDKLWKFNAKNVFYSHERVRLISGDKFYDLVAGSGSLSQLLTVLPSVISNSISEEEKITMGEIKAVKELKTHVGEELSTDNVLEFLLRKAYPNGN